MSAHRSRIVRAIPILCLLLLVSAPLRAGAQDPTYTTIASWAQTKDGLPETYRVVGPGIVRLNDAGLYIGSTVRSETKMGPLYGSQGDITRVSTGEFGAVFYDINASGTIVGQVLTENGATVRQVGYAAVWRAPDYKPERLDLLPGPNGEESNSSYAFAINDDGLVGGGENLGAADQYLGGLAMSWTDGIPTAIPFGNYLFCNVTDITPLGRIGAGCFDAATGTLAPVTWDGTTAWPETLPTGFTTAITADIADSPDGEGWAISATLYDVAGAPTQSQAVSWWHGTTTSLPFPSDHAFCTSTSLTFIDQKLAIVGNCGDSVGFSSDLTTVHAYVWRGDDPAQMQPEVLMTDPFMVVDINASGQIAGQRLDKDGHRLIEILSPAE